MTNTHSAFDSRLEKLGQKRVKLSHGYQSRVNQDGLIVFTPKRRQRGFPLRAVVFLVVGLFIFKGMIMAHIGPSIYGERVAALQAGTLIEQAGAYMMYADPVTESIANKIRPFVN